jgi:hypothetical protein
LCDWTRLNQSQQLAPNHSSYATSIGQSRAERLTEVSCLLDEGHEMIVKLVPS